MFRDQEIIHKLAIVSSLIQWWQLLVVDKGVTSPENDIIY